MASTPFFFYYFTIFYFYFQSFSRILIFPANASLFASLKDKHLQLTPPYIPSLTGLAGEELSTINLSDVCDEGYSLEWKDPSTTILSGSNSYIAVYKVINDDAGNYEILEIEITVDGTSAIIVSIDLVGNSDNVTGSVADGFTAVYNGSAHSLVPVIKNGDTEVDLGEFENDSIGWLKNYFNVTIRYNNDDDFISFTDVNKEENSVEFLIYNKEGSLYQLSEEYSVSTTLSVIPAEIDLEFIIPDNIIYSGSSPNISFNIIGETTIAEDEITIVYSTETFDAGRHTVTAKITNKNYAFKINDTFVYEKSTTFDIIKKTLYLKVIEISYNGSLLTWETALNTINSSIVFVDENNNVVSINAANYTVHQGMTDGIYGYGEDMIDSTSSESSIIGNTFASRVDLSHKNYRLESNDLIIKYKTAILNGNTDAYYTIEDAIAASTSSSDIILIVGSEDTTISTAFSNLSTDISNYTSDHYSLECKLRVPFGDIDLDYHGAGGQTSDKGANYGYNEGVSFGIKNIVYSALFIPSTVTLNIQSAGHLVAAGLITSCGVVNNRGVIMNEGVINAKSGSFISSYGYIKGNGTINLESGSIATDVMRIYDWVGGAKSSGLNSAKIFPVNAFSIHNISCKTYVYAGSRYEAFWTIEFNNRLYTGFQRGDNNGNVIIVGEGGLFEIENGYIYKTASNAINNSSDQSLALFTGSNQIKGQKEIVKIYGKGTDNQVSISIKASGTSFDMTTNANLFLPIAFMDITIGNDGTNVGDLTLSTSSFKFLPGSSLTVDEGAKLTVENVSLLFYSVSNCITDEAKAFTPYITNNGGVCVDRYDAYLTVNGTCEVVSGYIGGLIKTEGSTGKLVINSGNSVVNKYITSTSEGFLGMTWNVNTANKTYSSYGKHLLGIGNGSANKDFVANQTYLAKNNAWIGSSGTITYNPTLGSINTTSTTVTINGLNGYTIPSSINNTIPTAPNAHYTFGGWYIDEECSKSAVNKVIYGDITLYAKWDLVTYNIEYQYEYPDDFEGGNIENEPTQKEFNYLTSDFELTKPTLNDYKFDGWYLNTSYNKNELLTSFDVSRMLELVNSEKTVTLYARWLGNTINVNYVTNNTDYDNSTLDNINATTDALSAINLRSDVSSLNNDTGYYNYFLYWYYIDSNGNEIIVNNLTSTGGLSSDILQSHITNLTDITLYAKWEEKVQIVYKDYSNNKDAFTNECSSVYIKASDVPGYNLPVINSNNGNNQYPYYFNGWYMENEHLNKFTDILGVEAEPGTILNVYGYWVSKLVIKYFDCEDKEIENMRYYVISGTEITPEAGLDTHSISRDGYYEEHTFIEWQIDGSSFTENSPVYESVNILPKFNIYEYVTVTFTETNSEITAVNANNSSESYSESFEIARNSVFNFSVIHNGTVNQVFKINDEIIEGTSKDNVTLSTNTTVSASSESEGGCFATGTLITLSNGEQKPIEELTVNDYILVFNHDTGQYDSINNSYIIYNGENNYPQVKLIFNDGSYINVLFGHGFFDMNLNRYEIITTNNVENYLGHKFYSLNNTDGIILIDYELSTVYTGCYSILTPVYINHFANNLLCVSDDIEGLYNIFELDENMTVIQSQKEKDIETYGLYTYEEWAAYVTYEQFIAFNAQYVKIAIGKNLLTVDKIYYYIEHYLSRFS